MTKKSFRLYFVSKVNNNYMVPEIMSDLARNYSSIAKIVNVDKSSSTLTLISIGETKLYEVLDNYFQSNIKFVNIFVEQFKIEKYA